MASEASSDGGPENQRARARAYKCMKRERDHTNVAGKLNTLAELSQNPTNDEFQSPFERSEFCLGNLECTATQHPDDVSEAVRNSKVDFSLALRYACVCS